jgi:16S rRNA (guanine527-N7)-methyltransferase
MEILFKYFPDLTEHQKNQYAGLEAIYKDWNSRINVISRKDIDSLYEKHVLHSLAIARFCQFSPGTEIIDIGTGGGFPGVPLAIFFPEVKFHLVDSIGKKLKVIDAVTKNLRIGNITTKHSRIEDLKNRKFDFSVSRAVAPLKDLWHWSKPLLISKVRDAGPPPALICLKGGDLEQEIAQSHLQPEIIEISSYFREDYFKEKYLLYCNS